MIKGEKVIYQGEELFFAEECKTGYLFFDRFGSMTTRIHKDLIDDTINRARE